MEASERQHLESFLLLNSPALKLKQKLFDLLTIVETQRDTADWPKYLSTFGLCASELVEIRKFLESERFALAQSMILTPQVLSTEAEPNLAKATEDRLLMFNQDATPLYLRTKLDPQVGPYSPILYPPKTPNTVCVTALSAALVEALRAAVDARAASLRTSLAVSPEHALVLHEKLVVTLLDDVHLLKQEMDQDQEKLATIRSAANQDDLFSLAATMAVGRDYAMRMKPDGPK
ncbi:Mediator of RNA polymerase II transcription subunit [Echinococcus granulosus]|uniref:Mediator of RNA polymerase II transcription subunit 8 n=1 Tax=Echinococcus granulosus TaxID=6210 RepID=W6UTU6_ECHGR|nr:Mediator of RNA polymerase II transcription subunit [Echinococcus granulosus]EUB65055.1 Mediator of RNA polymerase II transcription subunit [Echinococcus granulosus]